MSSIRRLTAIQIRFSLGDENLLIRVSPGYRAYGPLPSSARVDLGDAIGKVLTDACMSMTGNGFDVDALVMACAARTLTTDFNDNHPRGARIRDIIVFHSDIQVYLDKPGASYEGKARSNRASRPTRAIRSSHAMRAFAPALVGVR